ncbi:MAG: pyridoxine 5'-phosphate synthase [Chthoniobacterales bacterium]|nr:pyridoxine 5'-phosphate synthase [Chthoniobacterales bacterium]
MTKLSVNINKIATLRNSRGGTIPNVLQTAIDIEHFGADGITVHPRPDERHIRYIDVRELKKNIVTEFNIEGNPDHPPFVDLVLEVKPDQVTLVPDTLGQLTSDHGWDTIVNCDSLKKIISLFKKSGIRVSLFVDPDSAMVEGAAAVGADRVELYTEDYARKYAAGLREESIASYVEAAHKAQKLGLGLNAGHDLDLNNLHFFKKNIPWLDEVSIGHALIADALYLGLEKTIQQYQEHLSL